MKNIVLTGFMGCGKTTVGRLLAVALAVPFVDADSEIEKAAGMEIPAIFQTFGEPYFRRLEEEQIDKILCLDGVVLATGGGAVVSECNRKNFHEKGLSIYLQLNLDECVRRISQDGSRPLGSGKPREELEALFASRRAFYEACDICYITDGKTPQQCAQELSDLLRPLIK